MAYNKYKDLKGRTQSDIVLKNEVYKVSTNPKIDGFQRALASMVSKFFDERSRKVLKGSGIENKQLADELHKPIIKNFKRRKVHSSFKDNIWGVHLADMSLISKFNKGIKYLLCVIHLFSRFAWVIGIKDKKEPSIVNGFKKILNSSERKPNKIWLDHGSEFYNKVFKKFVKENNVEMYSTHNEGKSVVAERFIKTLKNKIYKHMTTLGKNVYFNVLDYILNKNNNSFHSSIEMKPKDVTDDSFVYNEEFNKKDPKYQIGDNVRISKYKNIFAKGYIPNWSEKVFVVKMIKNTVLWTYKINNLNGEEILGSFYEKELQKTDQKEFRIEKVIKKKRDKLCVKWKGYDKSFNS